MNRTTPQPTFNRNAGQCRNPRVLALCRVVIYYSVDSEFIPDTPETRNRRLWQRYQARQNHTTLFQAKS
jgi:hypothetical protein